MRTLLSLRVNGSAPLGEVLGVGRWHAFARLPPTMLFAGGRTPPIHPEKPASLAYSAATCAAPELRLGLISQASSQLSTLSDLTNLPTPSTSAQNRPSSIISSSLKCWARSV